ELVASIAKQLGPFEPLQLEALLEVPRERFVRPEDIARSAEDTPLPLDEGGMATISAPHAYVLSFRLLDLRPGDRLLELGSGSGYGAALASYIVGLDGGVITVEIDEHLARWAQVTLADRANVRVVHGDAVDAIAAGRGANKIVVTFAVTRVPEA